VEQEKQGKKVSLDKINGFIKGKGEISEQNISLTLLNNYMPYAMSVILSRAIPEIDGFKPSHRKLLYTMYKMGLLLGPRTKSANVVGKTMQLNPHGDGAIYDTMVRLSRGHEALLYPLIDSKGNFGKYYSRDMASAASRYTEVKLDKICQELFCDIDKDTVDFIDNYDNTQKEPSLLPVRFPSILVNANTGIAVSMASSICSFNLKEICETTIKLIQNPNFDISKTLLCPDFPCEVDVINDKEALKQIYNTGRGRIKLRAKYKYDENSNCIDITSIPITTSCEAILEKIIDLVKQNKIKEISDIRDETGLHGLKITIDLKRGTDAHILMKRLYKMTTLEDFFSCNFNILLKNKPVVLGAKQILLEWISFRKNCIIRRTEFELNKKKRKLHFLEGLEIIVLDIDKVISIIQQTSKENEVIKNLMLGFSIDEFQAEYIADIKLRNLNREHILKQMKEKNDILEEVKELQEILRNKEKLSSVLIDELKEIIKKYKKPRNTTIVFEDSKEDNIGYETPDYDVTFFLTKGGYFKKITPLSLRANSEHKLKTKDKVIQKTEGNNKSDIIFFSNKYQVYKTKGYNFNDSKASSLGDYLPVRLSMNENESPIYMVATKNYDGFLILFFKNGKVSKINLSAYITKTNRKKLINAYSDSSQLIGMCYMKENGKYLLESSDCRKLTFDTSLLPVKTTKNSQGVTVFLLKKNQHLKKFKQEKSFKNSEFEAKKIPSPGKLTKKNQNRNQLKF
jgi:DNA gyrase subunit A